MSAVAITGAAGYVGSAIARCFRARGWSVLELGRRTVPPYDLAGPVHVDWSGIDAVVHCAWDFHLTRWADIERVNVQGSLRLIETAPVKHCVFISSLSSFEGCRSLYGKAKLAVEREALAHGWAVVRPGLVYGEHPGSTMASLEKAATAGAIVPRIGDGSYPQYPVHEDDLAALVFALCQLEKPPAEPISAASGEAIPLRELLRQIAARHGRKPLFVPVPWRLILAGLKGFEAIGLPPPFRSDSLIGIVFQNPKPSFDAAHAMVKFREFVC
jgi:nucleoside-diphosphate-sugar epimerase